MTDGVIGGVDVGVGVMEAVGDVDGVEVAVAPELCDGEPVKDGDGVPVGVVDGDGVHDGVFVAVDVFVEVGVGVGSTHSVPG